MVVVCAVSLSHTLRLFVCGEVRLVECVCIENPV